MRLYEARRNDPASNGKKLPSIHGNTTIPKLEMNAITLAAPLANAIITQLKGCATYKRNLYPIGFRNCLVLVEKLSQTRIDGNKKDCGTPSQRTLPYAIWTRRITPLTAEQALTKSEFSHHHWWTGPEWLQHEVTHWPLRNTVFGYVAKDQKKKVEAKSDRIIAAEVAVCDDKLLPRGRIHTFTRAKRIVAYALRFIRSAVTKINRKGGYKIAMPESAAKFIIKKHQRLNATSDIRKALKDLNIQKDKEGIYRCYGCLGKAQLEFSKTPSLYYKKPH
ncbi:hypothetical protein COOONC_28693 [Cooperia oncophora]